MSKVCRTKKKTVRASLGCTSHQPTHPLVPPSPESYRQNQSYQVGQWCLKTQTRLEGKAVIPTTAGQLEPPPHPGHSGVALPEKVSGRRQLLWASVLERRGRRYLCQAQNLQTCFVPAMIHHSHPCCSLPLLSPGSGHHNLAWQGTRGMCELGKPVLPMSLHAGSTPHLCCNCAGHTHWPAGKGWGGC